MPPWWRSGPTFPAPSTSGPTGRSPCPSPWRSWRSPRPPPPSPRPSTGADAGSVAVPVLGAAVVMLEGGVGGDPVVAAGVGMDDGRRQAGGVVGGGGAGGLRGGAGGGRREVPRGRGLRP